MGCQVSSQYHTYTVLSLVAELGGYTGLLVGACLYSVLEAALSVGAALLKVGEGVASSKGRNY